MPTINYQETLTVVTCICGINYAIPATLDKQLRDHCGEGRGTKSVYCPLGHQWHYTGKSAEERVAEEKRRTQAVRDLLAQEERSHVATRGHLTRVKKRVHKGVCPHCNRHFENLERHMHAKHPEGDE
jgi:hypothetical protein